MPSYIPRVEKKKVPRLLVFDHRQFYTKTTTLEKKEKKARRKLYL